MKDIKSLLLAAGFGTRLKPLTDIWPKCLMPIRNKPLLGYWLVILRDLGIDDVVVNTHYLSKYVEEFLSQPRFSNWVTPVYEDKLLGTAGTIRNNMDFLKVALCCLHTQIIGPVAISLIFYTIIRIKDLRVQL